MDFSVHVRDNNNNDLHIFVYKHVGGKCEEQSCYNNKKMNK